MQLSAMLRETSGEENNNENHYYAGQFDGKHVNNRGTIHHKEATFAQQCVNAGATFRNISATLRHKALLFATNVNDERHKTLQMSNPRFFPAQLLSTDRT